MNGAEDVEPNNLTSHSWKTGHLRLPPPKKKLVFQTIFFGGELG